MKKAVVTIATGDYFERMAALTHPTLRAYAERIGADFIVWNDTAGHAILEYKKLDVARLLDLYDRVLYVDTDVIIRDDAPDIFAIVPPDQLGMLEEGKYFDRRIGTLRFMEHVGFDSTIWDGKYYNAGIFVCSRMHRELFVQPPVEYDHFRDQTWFNTLIADRRVKVFQLPYRFNRLLALDLIYGEERLDAYFLHYAGVHLTMDREKTLELIASDLAAWSRMRPAYKFGHNVAFVIEGTLAEQVAAEPAVRYARNVMYREDNLMLVSVLPELFRHLGCPVFASLDVLPSSNKYHRRYTQNNPYAPGSDGMTRHQMHRTTVAAVMALRSELPVAARRPQLQVDPAAAASLAGKLRPHQAASLVLLHPGRGFGAANIFPADVWQSYADALCDAGLTVAVIGGRWLGEGGTVEFNRSRCLDLVDRLTPGELIALVAQARVLVANDSGPVQIAGAFDNWIGLIATARHPEYILPWRNGTPFWRAQTLERLPLYESYYHRPTGGRQPALDACDEQMLRAALPQPATVVQFAMSAMQAS